MKKCKTIFVLDDDIGFTRIVSIVLESDGYRVIKDNEGNIEKLFHYGQPDVVLLDCNLGRKSGVEICRSLKENPFTSGIPVILVSGEDNLDELAIRSRANDFLAKPFELNQLLIKIRGILENQQLASNSL